MVFNRLRDFRKNDLSISSTEKLADLLGGEEKGWYHQKIQRIETGQTSLSDEDAHYIASVFKVPVAALFEEPKRPELGEKLQEGFEAAEPHMQKAILEMLKIEE